ncbi:hypothetical protein, partial [Kaarinaea lacus]
MSFREIYQKTLDQKGYHRDDSQAKVVEHLEILYKALFHFRSGSDSWVSNLLRPFRGNKNNNGIKGCYLW